MSVTESIANFIAGAKVADIPASVLALARRNLIDTLGVTIGAAESAVDSALRKLPLASRSGEAFLWNGQGRAAALDAAWMNGALAHALDFDDGGVALTPMHPSSPVLPAIWALGERDNRFGRDLLAAYVLGLEVECKLAAAISLTHYDHGWHTTAVLGAFGAAAGAGWLLGLSEAQLRTAFGIAASMTGGLRANFGTMTKPLHAGLAARNGLMAVQLAHAGWSANQNILETKKGFFGVFQCGEVGNLKLGAPFHFESPGVSIKRFPSCSATHHCIEAMIALKKQHGLSADEIDRIDCRVHAVSYQALRKEPIVTTAEQGRFSLHFTTALVLLEGSVELKHFTPATFGRKDIQECMPKVTVAVHPELETLESKTKAFGQVDVRLKDG
ncbi:MAG TPA: MmgE/PrpD family protein, partial [Candidatus Limnocylindrales bacterium]|nr:MmgE/PrpD family protein [Candidatus Limnocylindrales bacterium]